jgi:AsmA protein
MGLMKPLIKWFLIGLAALLVLGVAVVIAVVTLVDPARYRTAVVDAVQQSTGRALSLGGDVGLKLLPCCAVELQQVALGNPPGFPAEPFLSIKSARLAIRLWPLLTRREVEIGTVSVDGLRVNLLGRKDGRNNWSFTRLSKDTMAGDANIAGGSVAGFNLAGIDIRDASLNYSDAADGSRYRVEQIQLTTGAVRDGKPFDLTASFRLTDLADNSGVSARLKAQTHVLLAGDVTTISLTRLDTELDTIGLAGLDTLTGRLQAPAVEVRLADDTLMSTAELMADLQLKGADLPGGSAPLTATLTNLRYDVDAGTGTVSSLAAKATLAGVALDVQGAGNFGTSNDLRGTLSFPAFSPREVLTTLKKKVPDTADPNVLKNLAGSANWFLRDKVVGLEKLALVLDDTNVTGSVSQALLPENSKATPRTSFDLTIDTLNADRYLAPDEVLPSKGGDGQQREAPTQIPAETLRSLNLEGRARIGRLTINKLQLADVDVTTSADAGRVRLEPLAATLYGGAFRGGIRLDATGPRTRVVLDQTFSNVNFGPLLTDLADVKNITGTMSLKLDGVAAGTTDDELLENLDGNLSFSLADGVYKGMDVWYEIRRAHALLRRTAPPARIGPKETPIKLLDLTGKLSNGELRTERFSAEIPFLRVSGAATVNLPKSTLDSDLTALVFEKPVFADDNSLEGLVNARIPLTVKGPIADPKVRVDLSKMVKGALQETLEETLKDKLRKKLGLGVPAGEEPPPADGDPATPAEKKKEDPVKKALDRLFR